jgi:hypothetical protein
MDGRAELNLAGHLVAGTETGKETGKETGRINRPVFIQRLKTVRRLR